MFRNSLNTELEPWRIMLDTLTTHMLQLCFNRCHNLLCSNRELERLPQDVDYTVRKEEIRPDTLALLFIREEIAYAIIHHTCEKSTHLAYSMIAKCERAATDTIQNISKVGSLYDVSWCFQLVRD